MHTMRSCSGEHVIASSPYIQAYHPLSLDPVKPCAWHYKDSENFDKTANLIEVKMRPSILNARSAEADVAGKEELASQYLARRGKSPLWLLHHSIGLSWVLTEPT